MGIKIRVHNAPSIKMLAIGEPSGIYYLAQEVEFNGSGISLENENVYALILGEGSPSAFMIGLRSGKADDGTSVFLCIATDTCGISFCSPTVTVSCCADPVPEHLCITLAATFSLGACLDGLTGVMDWNGLGWAGTMVVPGGDIVCPNAIVTAELRCDLIRGFVLTLICSSISRDDDGGGTLACNPFQYVARVRGGDTNCTDWDVIATITAC